MPVPRQRLIFRGRVLLPEQTIESYGVSDGAVLHLVTRPDPSTSAASSSSSSSSSSAQPNSTPAPNSAPSMRSASVGNTTIQVFNLGQLANGVSLANSVMSALGLNVPAAAAAASTPAAAATTTPSATATALLDLLDDNSVADVLASDAAMDHVGRATCERAAANLERLAAQLRRGELCQLRLQRNGELLRRLAADVQQAAAPAAAEAAPQRAPSGVQGNASLQDIVSATVARIGATDFNLQSLSQSIAPLLNQLSNAAAPVISSATSAAQLAMSGGDVAANRATPPPAPPVVPAAATATTASATPASDDNDHLDTMRALLKTVFGTLGVTSLLQIQGGDWSPMQSAHPNLRAALLEQLNVANASDVTPAMVSEFARQCATAVRHVAMRAEDVPPELAARIQRGSDPFAAIERETATHVGTFVHLLLKDWTPTPSQATPFGDASARWSNMFVSALVDAVRPTVVGGNDDIAAVLRHVCSKTLMASIAPPTATMLTNIVMSHVSRTHLKIEAKAVPVATVAPVAPTAAATTAARARPISTAGLEVFPAEWRETIARDLQTPVPPQGALSELYSRGQSQKQRAFDARLAAALSAAGVEGARAQRVLADVPQALKDEFE